MNNMDLTSVFLTNTIGLTLSLTMIVGNRWRFKEKDKENHIIAILLILTTISCIVDPIAYLTDGNDGFFCRIIVYATNSWYYLASFVGTAIWVAFMEYHIKGYISKRHAYILGILTILATLTVIINLFVPILFSVDKNNVYQRQAYALYFWIAAFCLVVDCVVLYFVLKKKSEDINLFPIFIYCIPISIGAIIQSFHYGISLAWPCAAISMAGVLGSLQNDMIFKDKLTGLYNRYYLDNINKHLKESKNAVVAIMMIDINDFKAINDNYGHLVGDKALVETVQILLENVNAAGTVVRYAGDEFIIIFKAKDKWQGVMKSQSLQEDFDKFNKTSGNPYELSVSIGCGIFDLRKTSIEEALEHVDADMYADKDQYYINHPEKQRRVSV